MLAPVSDQEGKKLRSLSAGALEAARLPDRDWVQLWALLPPKLSEIALLYSHCLRLACRLKAAPLPSDCAAIHLVAGGCRSLRRRGFPACRAVRPLPPSSGPRGCPSCLFRACDTSLGPRHLLKPSCECWEGDQGARSRSGTAPAGIQPNHPVSPAGFDR